MKLYSDLENEVELVTAKPNVGNLYMILSKGRTRY